MKIRYDSNFYQHTVIMGSPLVEAIMQVAEGFSWTLIAAQLQSLSEILKINLVNKLEVYGWNKKWAFLWCTLDQASPRASSSNFLEF